MTPELPNVATPDIQRLLPDADFPQADLENFNPGVSLASPSVIAGTVAAYGVEGEEGVQSVADRVLERATRAENGRFNKTDVFYQPIAPPPGVWDYRCRNCRFYQGQPGEESEGLCEIVGHGEDPFGGRSISPEAWCALWLPEDGDEWFSWVKRRMEGTGE